MLNINNCLELEHDLNVFFLQWLCEMCDLFVKMIVSLRIVDCIMEWDCASVSLSSCHFKIWNWYEAMRSAYALATRNR